MIACKKCKWWDVYSSNEEGFGLCRHPKMDVFPGNMKDDDIAADMVLNPGQDYSEFILFGAGFGCTHGEDGKN